MHRVPTKALPPFPTLQPRHPVLILCHASLPFQARPCSGTACSIASIDVVPLTGGSWDLYLSSCFRGPFGPTLATIPKAFHVCCTPFPSSSGDDRAAVSSAYAERRV